MANALENLVATPPSELGGARAEERLAYQRDWTLCEILRLHRTPDDYLVVCDYHDDVLVFDHSSEPSHVDFFQIKTDTSKRWTIPRLTKRPSGKKGLLPSALGKLYRHRVVFSKEARTLTFVSNLHLSVKLVPGLSVDTCSEFTALDLTAEESTILRNALQSELALDSELVLDAQLRFSVSSLSLADHKTHTIGHLESYLSDRDPTRTYPTSALYRAIADEILRCTKDENVFSTVTDLVRAKGISRKTFEETLASCLAEIDGNDPRTIASALQAQLAGENVAFGKRQQVCRELSKFAVERLDSTRADLAKWSTIARAFIGTATHAYGGSLWDLLLSAKDEMKQKGAGKAFSDEYVIAIAAWEVLTHDWSIQTSNPKPEDQEA